VKPLKPVEPTPSIGSEANSETPSVDSTQSASLDPAPVETAPSTTEIHLSQSEQEIQEAIQNSEPTKLFEYPTEKGQAWGNPYDIKPPGI
jgi:hypothetical protein